MQIANKSTGVLGLQCKDGMIISSFIAAIFMIQKYGFEVDATVGYLRMVRPGCLYNKHH